MDYSTLVIMDYNHCWYDLGMITTVLNSRWLPELQELIQQLASRIENKVKLKKPNIPKTEMKPFNITQPRPRSVPLPQPVSSSSWINIDIFYVSHLGSKELGIFDVPFFYRSVLRPFTICAIVKAWLCEGSRIWPNRPSQPVQVDQLVSYPLVFLFI